MKLIAFLSFLIILIALSVYILFYYLVPNPKYDAQQIPQAFMYEYNVKKLFWRQHSGQPTVAIQVGHLDIANSPDELKSLRQDTGAEYGSIKEVDVNKAIATLVAKDLKQNHISVTILPATIPPGFYADAFVAIHADGNADTNRNGYKSAIPWHDLTGKANILKRDIDQSYLSETKMRNDDQQVTIDMKGYYPFSWWRFNHALSPFTPAVIVETGYISNYNDQQIIVDNPQLPADAIASGIEMYLKQEKF